MEFNVSVVSVVFLSLFWATETPFFHFLLFSAGRPYAFAVILFLFLSFLSLSLNLQKYFYLKSSNASNFFFGNQESKSLLKWQKRQKQGKPTTPSNLRSMERTMEPITTPHRTAYMTLFKSILHSYYSNLFFHRNTLHSLLLNFLNLPFLIVR